MDDPFLGHKDDDDDDPFMGHKDEDDDDVDEDKMLLLLFR